MKEQTIQAKNSYNFELQIFNLSIHLQEDADNREIQIQLINRQQGKTFELIVNQSYINQSPVLSFIYETPLTLFSEFVVNAKRLQISKEGRIKLMIELKGNLKELTFQTKEKICTKQELMIRKLSKKLIQCEQKIKILSEEVQLLREQRREMVRIENYQAYNQMIMEQINKIKKDIASSNDKIKQSQINENYAIQLGNKHYTYKNQIEIIKQEMHNYVKQTSKKIEILQKQFILFDEKTNSQSQYQEMRSQVQNILSEKIQPLERKQVILIQPLNQIINTIKSINQYKFEIRFMQNKQIIKYKKKQRNKFIYPFPLMQGRISKLYIKHIYHFYNPIEYGLASAQLASLQSISKTNIITLLGNHLKNGDVITIIADLINNKIKWEINHSLVDQRQIKIEKVKNHIYFVVSVKDKGSQFQILRFQ